LVGDVFGKKKESKPHPSGPKRQVGGRAASHRAEQKLALEAILDVGGMDDEEKDELFHCLLDTAEDDVGGECEDEGDAADARGPSSDAS
jgi:hypothetical protein